MPDKKDLGDQIHDSRVPGDEDHQINYLMEKTGASRREIERAIAAVGNNRKKIEEFLKKNKKE